MSFADCVEAAVKSGRITRDQAEELFQRQRDGADRFTLDPQHSPESAFRMGVELGIERGKQDVRLQKYQAALQAIRNSQNSVRVLDYEHGPTRGVRTLLARDSRGLATWSNIETRGKGIAGQAHGIMADGLSQLRTRWAGLHQDKQLLRASVREMFGEQGTYPGARQIAETWAKATEQLRVRFNRAGGAIPKREGWGLPQSHDSVLVGRASSSEWVDYTATRLDLEKMVDVETGQPFTEPALRAMLQGVYETIRTNGVSDMVPGAQGGKKLANRRQESRFLVFKNADTWLEYQERFGSSNLFGTMMDHIDGMARDISLLEVMGPNPSAAFKYLQDIATRVENEPLRRGVNQRVFDLVNGTGDRNKSPMMANIFGAVRSWNVAASLGSAALSAISDTSFMANTARWNGMNVTRTLTRYAEQLNPANEADRILATRIGITAMSWSNAYSNIGRFSEIEGAGGGALGKVAHAGNMFAEITLRASGLNAMTDAGRRAFAMEFSANLAENFDRPLGKVEGRFGQVLQERGVTAAEWETLRATPTTDHNGAKFFTVDQLMERPDLSLAARQDLAAKIQGIINEEILYAVPEPDALARVITTGGVPRGTLTGELTRSVTQFKSFPIAVLSLHAQRAIAARQLRGGMSAAGYAASTIIGTTVMGMVAMQMKLISKGKDPRDMDDPKAWSAAFVQGGGAGIYGDFLFNDANRFGSGPITTLSGPSLGLAEDALRVTWGNAQQLMAGEDPKLAAEMVGFGKRYMPGGSLWYTRLVLEREIWDQLALEADPTGTRRRFQRQQRRAREQGTGFWWRPGETAPDRLPEVGE